jgi:hypothetical protein
MGAFEELTLIEKAQNPESGPSFYPGSSIMD